MAVEGKAKPAASASPVPSVPTDQMLAQVQERIEALEVKSRTDEEIERGLAADAQDALATVSAEAKTKTDPMAALESKYLELYQDLQRRQRNHEKSKQQLFQECTFYRKENTRLSGEKKKIEELCRTLTKERSAFRGQGQNTDASRGKESPSKPAAPQPAELARTAPSTPIPKPAPPPHITFVISSRYRRPLWFKVQRHTKLSSVFNNWLDRQDGSTVPAEPPVLPAKATKKARQAAVNAAAKAPPRSNFVFTYGGKVLDTTKTAGEAELQESDEIVAFELVDLTEDLSIPLPQVEKLKRHWSLDVKNRNAALEEMLSTVCRQRLKVMLQLYDSHSELWLSILRNKELEFQLFKAKVAASEGRLPKLDATIVTNATLLATDLVEFGTSFEELVSGTIDTLDYFQDEEQGMISPKASLDMKKAFVTWRNNFLNLVERGLEMNRAVQGPAIKWTRPVVDPLSRTTARLKDGQDLMNDVD